MIEMTNLTSQTSYQLSSMIISSENIVYKLGSNTFTTLKTDFVPENITDIKIDEYHALNDTMGRHVDVVFKWEPARDETCIYEFLIHYEDSGILQYRKQFPDIFHHVQMLPYDMKVNVAVRGLNSLSKRRESQLKWTELTVDNCMSHKDNASICGPENIVNLTDEIVHIRDNVFDVNLKWNKPSHSPERYTLTVKDVNPRIQADGTPEFIVRQIEGVSFGLGNLSFKHSNKTLRNLLITFAHM